jgi:hypothetical protein
MEDSLDVFVKQSSIRIIVAKKQIHKMHACCGDITDIDMTLQYICTGDWIVGFKWMMSRYPLLAQQCLLHTLTTACMHGRIAMIVEILTHPFDIPATFFESICATSPPSRLASWTAIIDILLQDDRIDPGSGDSIALCLAVARRDVNLAAQLLVDSRIDPTAPFRHNSFCDTWNPTYDLCLAVPAVFWIYATIEQRQTWYEQRGVAMYPLKIELVSYISFKGIE